MPRNNGDARKEQRKAGAKHRAETYDNSPGAIVQRAHARGYHHKGELDVPTPAKKKRKERTDKKHLAKQKVKS